MEESVLVKGCEHAYCMTCTLRWASYQKNPSCPQCKHPFDSLNIHCSLDGWRVFAPLRATWFVPLTVEEAHEDVSEEMEYLIYQYYDEVNDDDDDLNDAFHFRSSSSNIRISNIRWGDNGYVRAGRKEACPVHRPTFDSDSEAGPSQGANKKKEAMPNDNTGHCAKRAMKREAADKAAAASTSSTCRGLVGNRLVSSI